MRFSCAAFALTLLLFAAACGRTVSTTELRLEAHTDGEKEWVEVLAPEPAKQANGWIRACTALAGRRKVEVLYQSPRVLSLACRGDDRVLFASFRVDTGQHLGLKDILRPGAEDDLRAAAERVFHKRHQQPAPITDDFALNAQGLVFYSGKEELFIPVAEIRPLLRPEAGLLVGR